MIILDKADIEECETVFHKKLKVKLKEKGIDGRISFLQDYLDYIIRKKTTLPPDFPTFCREIAGLDDRSGWIHITVWNQDSELKQFAESKGYECRVEHYD